MNRISISGFGSEPGEPCVSVASLLDHAEPGNPGQRMALRRLDDHRRRGLEQLRQHERREGRHEAIRVVRRIEQHEVEALRAGEASHRSHRVAADHRCALLDIDLGPGDLRVDCPDHEGVGA